MWGAGATLNGLFGSIAKWLLSIRGSGCKNLNDRMRAERQELERIHWSTDILQTDRYSGNSLTTQTRSAPQLLVNLTLIYSPRSQLNKFQVLTIFRSYLYQLISICNRKEMHKEIKHRLNSGNACYYGLQGLCHPNLSKKTLNSKYIKRLFSQLYYMDAKHGLLLWGKRKGCKYLRIKF